mgnify:FL=1
MIEQAYNKLLSLSDVNLFFALWAILIIYSIVFMITIGGVIIYVTGC